MLDEETPQVAAADAEPVAERLHAILLQGALGD